MRIDNRSKRIPVRLLPTESYNGAADYLEQHDGASVMNLGIGEGFSMFDIIHAVERVTGCTVEFDVEGRRPGDPPRLVANATLARSTLDCGPRYDRIDSIIETAWVFH
jgi:UDP-glucose 4-epimerase